MKRIPFYDLKITDRFWQERQQTVRDTTIWAVYDRFKETGRIDTMDGSWQEGMPNKPHIFWGSDVFKWMESAAYLLEEEKDERLIARVESIIDDMEKAVMEDGYYNSYYCSRGIDEPRFTRRDNHELYSLGHMIEAAVALHHATGNERLLKLACKNADLVDRIFRIEHSAAFDTPGHEEIELALVKLYRATGEERYLHLSEYFVRTRGTSKRDENICVKTDRGEYSQSHLPIVEQHEVWGHAVRAMYLYCAVADLAEELNDAALYQAAERLFLNVYEKKMYITGGVGSLQSGEAFSAAWHLPNREAYTETCAALGLALFGARLSAQKADGRFGDAVERALYNGMISGLSLSGDAFFYENPLEMDLSCKEIPPYALHLPPYERKKVFSCSCCPPNLTRLIPSVGDFVYSYDEDRLYVHQYIANRGLLSGKEVCIEGDYSGEGRVIVSTGAREKLALRKPAWCRSLTASAPYTEKDGYLYFDTNRVQVEFDMTPTFLTAADAVHADQGRVALMRGPIVYCLEEQDQPGELYRCRVNPRAAVAVDKECLGGYPVLLAQGVIKPEQKALYVPYEEAPAQACTLKYIPYYAFANRGEDNMQVWILAEQ